MTAKPQPQSSPAAAPRKPPIPPPMMTRIVLLCLRPEYWPQAARYPLSATLWAVLVVAVAMSTLVSASASRSVMKTFNAFAAGYDGQFYPMELKDGKLSRLAGGPAANGTGAPTFVLRNIPYWSTAPWAGMEQTEVIFDPENKIHPELVEGRGVTRFTDTEIVRTTLETDFFTGRSEEHETSVPLAPLAGDRHVIINGQTLASATESKSELAILIFLMTFICHCFTSLLWAFLMAVLMIPLVLMSAARLAMPRHVAFRIGLAVTVPLLAIGGILEATGLLAQTSVPVEVMPLFWALCASGMAFWSGMLANRIYAPRRRAPKGGM